MGKMAKYTLQRYKQWFVIEKKTWNKIINVQIGKQRRIIHTDPRVI